MVHNGGFKFSCMEISPSRVDLQISFKGENMKFARANPLCSAQATVCSGNVFACKIVLRGKRKFNVIELHGMFHSLLTHFVVKFTFS